MANNFKIGTKGLDLIKKMEGLRLTSYLCAANVLTIGYGSTGKHVKKGQIITESYAEKLLLEDIARFEKAVNKLVKSEINQKQFDALVSFAFNLGEGALGKSTLLKKVNINPSDASIAAEFAKWNKAGGKVLNGLVKRRTLEAELYFS
jgi:lysozyme